MRPEPVPLEPPTPTEPQPPPSRGIHSRTLFILLGVAVVLVLLWIIGDIVLKKMAMQILFDGSNLPTITRQKTPVPQTTPAGPVRMGSFDLNRDVRVVY